MLTIEAVGLTFDTATGLIKFGEQVDLKQFIGGS